MTTISGEIRAQTLAMLSEYIQTCEAQQSMSRGIIREAYKGEAKEASLAIDAAVGGDFKRAQLCLGSFCSQERRTLQAGIDPPSVWEVRNKRSVKIENLIRDLTRLI